MRHCVFAIVALLVSGCAATPATPAEYLLGGPQPASSLQRHTHADAAFVSVSVAEYLDRPEIVVETRDGVVQPAFSHRWAEPLAPALRRILSHRITGSSGQVMIPEPTADVPVRVDLTIERLHGTETGRVMLVARWTVRSADTTVHHRMAETTHTRADGYPALVQAHDELIDALARAIGQSLEPGTGT